MTFSRTKRGLASFIILGADAGCGPSHLAEPDIEVVVHARIPLDRALEQQPAVLVRSAESAGAFFVAALGGDRVFLVHANGSWSVAVPPESLLRVSSLGVQEDFLWVADDAARRVLLVGGTTARRREILTPTIQPHVLPHVVGPLSNDAFVVASRPERSQGDTLVSLISIMSESEAVVIDSAVEIGGELRVGTPGGDAFVTRQPWFYHDVPLINRSSRTLTILRQRPGRSNDVAAIVEVHESRGSRGGAVAQELSLRPIALTDAAVAAWLKFMMQDSLVSLLGGRRRADSVLRTALYRPGTLPAIRRAISASTETLLLERVTADSSHHWEVWQAGKHNGSFVLDPWISLQDAADSTIWAVTRRATGIDSILVATLRERAHPRRARRTASPTRSADDGERLVLRTGR